MTILKNGSTNTRISKTISYMIQDCKNDFNPQFSLHIRGCLIPKVVLDFGSQVNILTKRTWEKLNQPLLVKSDYYLKLANQGLIQPMGLCKNVETVIMGVSVITEFKFIESKEEIKSYATLVGWPWARTMKEKISLEKDKIKL